MEKELLNKIKIEKEKLLQNASKIIGVFGFYTKTLNQEIVILIY